VPAHPKNRVQVSESSADTVLQEEQPTFHTNARLPVKPLTEDQVINPILNCNSKIDILRVLARAEDPLTGRRIALLGGISGRSCQLSLQALTEAGILIRKVVGRAHTYTLNRDHRLVREVVIPLFQTEDALVS